MSAQRFRSRIDGLFYFVFALGVGLPLAVALLALRDGRWLSLAVAGAVAVFLTAMARTTYYVIDDQFLKVRCLIASTTIPLASITALRPTHNPLSAPALSLDRLEVMYQGDRPGFAPALTVSGVFGTTVPMSDIADVTIEDHMPRVVRKRSGSDAVALRGLFELEGMGDGRIYVQRSSTLYVHIRTKDGFVYINYSDGARTQALFDEISRARLASH